MCFYIITQSFTATKNYNEWFVFGNISPKNEPQFPEKSHLYHFELKSVSKSKTIYKFLVVF